MKIWHISLLVIVSFHCKSQINNGIIYYSLSFKNDTLSAQQQEIKNIPTFLYYNEQTAIFVYDAERDKRENIGNVIYTYSAKNQMCIRTVIPAYRVYTYEPHGIPKIKWQICPETKKIQNYTCQKAITTFRGRTWQAWFTPQIPIKFGPWKLHGLPGLILTAYTQDSVIVLQCNEIEIPVKQDNIQKILQNYSSIPYHKNDVKTSWQEYKEHYKTRIDKKIKEITAQMNAEEERSPEEERVKYHFQYKSIVPEWEIEFE